MPKASEIDALLARENWHDERKALRTLALGCGLEEAVKWGKLCYSIEGGNVALIFAMKQYCALGFFKGSLLTDTQNALVAPGEHSQAMRQLRFTSLDEITSRKALIKQYIAQAIQLEKDGREVAFAEKDNLAYPDALQDALDDDPRFAEAFAALTPGRQRGYVLHFSGAKQASTRATRVAKCKPAILDGKGLNDR